MRIIDIYFTWAFASLVVIGVSSLSGNFYLEPKPQMIIIHEMHPDAPPSLKFKDSKIQQLHYA